MSGSPELVRILDAMARERDLDKEILFESLEIALIAAARKKYDQAVELDVNIDRETGEIVGIQDGVTFDTQPLGRIAAQTAKQVMIQKIREAEQDRVFEEFNARRGALLTGNIQRFEGENVIVDLNKAEAIMPRHEKVKTETYHVGDRIRCVIADVKKVGHRVRIVVSRSHPDLIRRLFELEIPEIAEHVIEIKAIAREAGFRTKLAVVSYDTKVDCVGACVGIRGARIRNIIDELNGEKIDIIRWNDSPEVLIMNALKPAEIQSITLDDETREAVVTVADDQLSLAIGKRGQNVRLAARLTGWDVNIVSATGESAQSQSPGAKPLSEAEQLLLEQLRTGQELSVGGLQSGESPEVSNTQDVDPLLELARQVTAVPASAASIFRDDVELDSAGRGVDTPDMSPSESAADVPRQESAGTEATDAPESAG